MAEIVVLRSGSGFAFQERINPCIALLAEDRSYLLDCGEPAAVSLFLAGIDPLSVRAIFISHLSPDHIGGLAQLLSSVSMSRRSPKDKVKEWSITRDADWYRSALRFPERVPEGGPEFPVDLFIPAEGISGISAYLDTVYLSPDLLPFTLNIFPVEPGRLYQDHQVSVSAIYNTHLANKPNYRELQNKNPEEKFQSYSFVVEFEGVRILYG